MDTKRLLLVLVSSICLGVVVCFIWLISAMFLYSLNDFEIKTYETGFTGKTMTWNKLVLLLMLYKCFILYWLINIMHDSTVYITMASVTSYYFSSTKD